MNLDNHRGFAPIRGDWWKWRQLLWLTVLALFVALAGCGGGGGGGGKTGTPTSVSGRVLRAENNAPEAGTTINLGGQTATAAQDGTFTFANVTATAKTATVTPPKPALPRTLPLALTAKIANNLGDIYVSDTGYTASVSGTVVAPVNGAQQPVGNVTVTIAGSQVKTGTNGTFSIPNLPVGLGADPNTAIGSITATDFDAKLIFVQFPLTAGDNALGTLLLGAPVGNTPPTAPYTIKGTITSGGKPAAGVTVSIAPSGGNPLPGSAVTDAAGTYTFWVVPGQYNISAMSSGGGSQTIAVTLAALDNPVTAPAIAF